MGVKRGREPLPDEERLGRLCKARLNEFEWKRFKDMQSFTGETGSDLIRKALKYYDQNVLKRK